MRIVFDAVVFNSIMKRCKPFIGSAKTSPMLALIRIRAREDLKTCEVTALNGSAVIHFCVKCVECDAAGDMLVPYFKPVGAGEARVELYDDGEDIILKTSREATAVEKTECEYIEVSSVWPKKQTEHTVYFDAKLLAGALSAFGGKPVKIEFMGCATGCVLSGEDGVTAFVLPLNPKRYSSEL